MSDAFAVCRINADGSVDRVEGGLDYATAASVANGKNDHASTCEWYYVA